jgi:hypothetical protein
MTPLGQCPISWDFSNLCSAFCPKSGGISNWNIEATRDFNGDGTTDLLLRRLGDGRVSTATLDTNGQLIAEEALFFKPASNWNIEKTEDFNGDGITDIVTRKIGDGSVWNATLDSNGQLASEDKLFYRAVANWQFEGTDDYNGDGITDILMRRISDGRIYTEIMDSTGLLKDQFPIFNRPVVDFEFLD